MEAAVRGLDMEGEEEREEICILDRIARLTGAMKHFDLLTILSR